MPDSSPNSDAPDSARLFCAHCDYDLTGLIESRCPECGQSFDVEELKHRTVYALKPITWPRLLSQVLTIPTCYIMLVAASFGFDQEWLYGTAMICALVIMPVTSGAFADRVFANLRARSHQSPYSRVSPARWFALLAAFLLFQVASGCYGSYWVIRFLAD